HAGLFFFSSRRRHTRSKRDWSSDVCSSDLLSRLHITERDLPVTSLILREVDEIQDTDMDALLQFIVIITFLNLAGIDLAHIEEQIGRASCRERVWSGGGYRTVEGRKTEEG